MFMQAGPAVAPKSLALLRACSVLQDLRGLDTYLSSVKLKTGGDGGNDGSNTRQYGCSMDEWCGIRGLMTLLDCRRHLLFYRPFSSYF